MINSITGFLTFPTQGNVSRIYADTYSQEDRLKHLSDLLQRMLEWQKVSVEKINEVIEVANFSGAADAADLYKDIQALKTEMLAVQGEIATLTSEISEVSDDLGITNNSVTELSTSVDAIESSVTDLISSISAVEAGLQNTINEVSVSVETTENTEITFSRTKNGLSENYGSVTLKSSDDSIIIDSVGSEIDLKAVGGSGGGETDPELEGRVSTLENEEFVSSASLSEPITNYGFVLKMGKKTGAGVEVPEDSQEDRLYLEFQSTDDSIDISAYKPNDNRVVLNLTAPTYTPPQTTSYNHNEVPVDSLTFGSGDSAPEWEQFTITRVDVEFEDLTAKSYYGITVIAEKTDGRLYWKFSSELSEKIQDYQPTGTVDLWVFVKEDVSTPF